MNDTKFKQMANARPLPIMNKYLTSLLAICTILITLSCSSPVKPVAEPEIDPTLQQAVFKTPEAAANTFAQAVRNDDQALFNKLLGADFRDILPLDDVSPEDLDNFNNAWEKHHTLLAQGDKKTLLAIGKEEWTLPVPIVEGKAGWYFDVDQGLELMRIRRIGRNELASIQSVLAYYDAQMEYATQDHDNNGVLEYAQKFISTPGTQDGLYWDAAPGEVLSPLGKLLADRSEGGGYHGYFFRILKAQGPNAKGGAYSYMMGENMRAGFAVIAWPEKYGDSGIMSFIVSHDGIVYQQDLGPDSANIAESMPTYNPDADWIPVHEEDSPESKVAQ
ncbi:hypothetical protein AU255_04060 [Methyloprofundus sedimenti]|uniref:DUF2950 domain-containing protein n=1 Tax=Methyloprofundus sedimenti TaxID=1420851 RepID=A0A1V8M693_9GAMM|nr:DUF2950 domain-containing protein [Methyloprofundus sedimenti]OQK17081.1 hypothetical protein AU255_04060 [Methyloprofundus sedimenti]